MENITTMKAINAIHVLQYSTHRPYQTSNMEYKISTK